MKTTIVALCLAVAAGAAQAEVKSYECKLHSIENRGWIPPVVYMSVDAENKRARAYDGAIRAFNEYKGWSDEKPMETKFKITRKNEYRMQWKVTLSSNSTRRVRLSYTATLDPKTNKFGMIARFPMDNATNRPRGVGSCIPVSSPSLL